MVLGHCACKAIQWSTEAAVIWAGHCHCESCRRACSAPLTSWIGLPVNQVSWQGEPTVWSSSPNVQRGHCGKCASPLFYRSQRWPKEIHLYAATLENPKFFSSQAHYHFAERVNWLSYNDGLKKFMAGDLPDSRSDKGARNGSI